MASGKNRHYHADSAVYVGLSGVNKLAMLRYIGYLHLKAYSRNTLRTYAYEFRQFLLVLKTVDVNSLSAARIADYARYCLEVLKLRESTVHSRLNAIKFYYQQVVGRRGYLDELPRPKKPRKLPTVLSVSEVQRLFHRTPNLKHNTMLKVCYGMGLRVSEITKLKICHINTALMTVLLEEAKGKKDRYVNLPASLLGQLRAYVRAYSPNEFLFEGQGGGRYSIRSAQQVFTNALVRAQINVKTGIHCLRHSFATHLIDQGTNMRFIQELLGHDDIRTTMRYTHVTTQTLRNVKSPLDFLDGRPKRDPSDPDRPWFF